MKQCELTGCDKPAYCKNLCKSHYNKQWRYDDVRYNGKINRRKKIEFEIDNNGCFNCTSHAERKDGYISYQYNGKQINLHRYIYEEMFGTLPDNIVVRHKCDNRRCINPEHLESGTHLENMRDMVEHGRSCYGEKSHFSKLTEVNVKEIKQRLKNGETCASISRYFNVSRMLISRIKNGKAWKYLDEVK